VTAAVALLAVLGVALPHFLGLDRARPATAAILWLTALTMRALVAVSLGLYAVLAFPDTQAFKLLTHWCDHVVLPLLGMHADLEGHALGAVAVLVPLVISGGALLVAGTRTARTARSIHAMLRRHGLGAGPEGSVIVGGDDVAVAAAGLLRPRVVVTAGALATLEDDELSAGLAHERGHIAHRHHLLLAYAECCRALAGPMPGTRRAIAEFRFQLERDADAWALRRHHHPDALASAICKAANARSEPLVVGLGGGALERRVDQLMSVPPARPRVLRRVVDSAAVLMVCVTLSSTVAIPAEAIAGGHGQVAPHGEHHCNR
jgi:hypothetical protein